MGRKPEGKAEKILKKFGKRVDGMITELKDVTDNTGAEVKQRIDELSRNTDSLSEQFQSFKENHKEKWEDVQNELDRAAQELRKAFKSLFANRKATYK